MSNAALNWAFAMPIKKASDKLLLVCLANYADEDGLCFPSQAKIIADTSLDRKTVIASIQRLMANGLMTDSGSRKGATRQIVVYRLAVGAAMSTGESVPETGPSAKGPKNGTVPHFPPKSPTFPEEESRISREIVPFSGHGTSKEPPKGKPPGESETLVDRAEVDLFPTLTAAKSKHRSKANPPKVTEETPEFLAFWAAYPRKDARGGARGAVGAWHAATKRATPTKIMAGLARYAFSDERKYQPLAATWLNQDRWRVEVDTAPVTVAVPASSRLSAADVIGGQPPGTLQATLRATLARRSAQARSPPSGREEPPVIDLDRGDYCDH